MQSLKVALLLALLACKGRPLVHTRDPRCDAPCYRGNPVQAGLGVCQMGTWTCDEQGTVLECTGWGSPQVQYSCDGKDYDCDGRPDSFLSPCSTICGSGLQTCDRGHWWNDCTAQKPTPEICNGKDDDCDQEIDEIIDLPLEPCYTGDAGELLAPQGDCHPGIYKCERGHRICRNEKKPTPETCDQVDNDCNQQVDEGLLGCGEITPGNLQVVLSWNHPDDMDLHLLHPSANDSHNGANWSYGAQGLDCFYGLSAPNWDDQTSNQDDPALDHDDTVYQGPETITLSQPVINQPYTIGVFSYNYPANVSSVITTIKVYCDGALMTTQSYSFTQIRRMWVVGTVSFDNQGRCTFLSDGNVVP